MTNKLPNLLIIGAMKAGTTSLHNYLAKHPDIFMSEPKEIHYYIDEHYQTKTIDWYKSFFKTDKKIIGTSPQSYTKCHHKLYKNIPERIFKDSPDIKLIYLVRDPIERYKSHILESYHCDPPKKVRYSKHSENYLKTSMYYMQITSFLEYFKKEQILVVSSEDLKTNRLEELNTIFNFLEVDKLENNSIFDFESNTALEKKVPHVIKYSMPYRAGNKISPKMTEKIGAFFSKTFLKYQTEKPKLTDSEYKSLFSKLKPDIDKFRKLTGKEFPQWNI
jgi:hypothetical protein